MFHLNYRDARPIYEQVVDGIEQLVMHGVLVPDGQLPSVRQLAAELSINPNTVQRAYGELEYKGVIYSVKGKGNFVSPDCARLKSRYIAELQEELTQLVQKASTLGVEKQTLVAWITKGE